VEVNKVKIHETINHDFGWSFRVAHRLSHYTQKSGIMANWAPHIPRSHTCSVWQSLPLNPLN